MTKPTSDALTWLIVDDDEVFSRVLKRSLTKYEYQVHIAHDNDQALQSAEQYLPDYIILDLNIGQNNGIELITPLLARAPNAKILMLTGYASIATAVEAIKRGACNYLCKPADADDVLAALLSQHADLETLVPDNPMSVDRLQWEHIQRVLAEHDGNISATARALKMHRRTLQRKLAKRPVKE